MAQRQLLNPDGTPQLLFGFPIFVDGTPPVEPVPAVYFRSPTLEEMQELLPEVEKITAHLEQKIIVDLENDLVSDIVKENPNGESGTDEPVVDMLPGIVGIQL